MVHFLFGCRRSLYTYRSFLCAAFTLFAQPSDLHARSVLGIAATHPCYDARLALLLLTLPGHVELDKWLEDHSTCRAAYACWFKLLVRQRNRFIWRFMQDAVLDSGRAETVLRLVDEMTTAYVATHSAPNK